MLKGRAVTPLLERHQPPWDCLSTTQCLRFTLLSAQRSLQRLRSPASFGSGYQRKRYCSASTEQQERYPKVATQPPKEESKTTASPPEQYSSVFTQPISSEEWRILIFQAPKQHPKATKLVPWRHFLATITRTVVPIEISAYMAYWMHSAGWDSINLFPHALPWFRGVSFLALLYCVYRAVNLRAALLKTVSKLEYLPLSQKVRLSTPLGEVDWPLSWIGGAGEQTKSYEEALEEFNKQKHGGLFLPLSMWEPISATEKKHQGLYTINFDPNAKDWFVDAPRLNAIMKGQVPVVCEEGATIEDT